jgi:hypothetical protein
MLKDIKGLDRRRRLYQHTPVQIFLDCWRIGKAGIKPKGIKILVAKTPADDREYQSLGKTFQKHPILNHHSGDLPLPILNRQKRNYLYQSNGQRVDLIIGVGQIVPHRVTGFSGGGNIIQPGICGEETTGKTHWLCAQFKGREILGKIENPVKDEIEKIAKAGLKWIVNTIQDGRGQLVER